MELCYPYLEDALDAPKSWRSRRQIEDSDFPSA
jgi:hypothetical protein